MSYIPPNIVGITESPEFSHLSSDAYALWLVTDPPMVVHVLGQVHQPLTSTQTYRISWEGDNYVGEPTYFTGFVPGYDLVQIPTPHEDEHEGELVE